VVVGVALGAGVWVAVATGVCVGVATGVSVAVAIGVCVGVATGVFVAVGDGWALPAAPYISNSLSQLRQRLSFHDVDAILTKRAVSQSRTTVSLPPSADDVSKTAVQTLPSPDTSNTYSVA
jgi:hypothetical protein